MPQNLIRNGDFEADWGEGAPHGQIICAHRLLVTMSQMAE